MEKTIKQMESKNGWLVRVYEYGGNLHITDCDDDFVYIPDDLLVKVANELLKFATRKRKHGG